MATLYLKAAGGNWTDSTTWSTTGSGGADNSGPPTAADDCIAELLSGNLTISATSTGKSFSTTAGTGSWAGTLTHNAFVWTVAGSITFNSGITYTPLATSTVTLSANNTLTTAGKLLPLMILNTGTTTTLGDNLSFMASKVITLTLNGNSLNINGKTVSGNSAINRVLILSNTVGTARTITTTTGTFDAADFQDITASTAIDLSAATNYSGDCGGNSGITFTTGATQTWSGTSGGNWSTNVWTGRVPLPQDDVIISSAFSASQTVTLDMPRAGRSINWTGSTGSPIFTLGTDPISFFGSLTLISGMSFVGIITTQFRGRSSYTLDFAGKSLPGNNNITAPGGTYTLTSAYTSGGAFTVNNGGFDTGNFSFAAISFNSTNSNTRSITLGTSTLTLNTSVATNIWSLGTTTGLTFSGSSSTISIIGTTSNTRTFAGGSLTYGALSYVVSGATGQLNISGSNSFAAINFSDESNARSLKFTAGTTTTIRNTNGFNVYGSNGHNMTVDSITAANHTLTSTGQQGGNIDYLTLGHSVVDASPKWYAGANSTDGGTNTNWIFTAAPPQSSSAASIQSVRNLMNLQRL